MSDCHFCIKPYKETFECGNCHKDYPGCDHGHYSEYHKWCDDCLEPICKTCLNNKHCFTVDNCSVKTKCQNYKESFLICSDCYKTYERCEKCHELIFGCNGCTGMYGGRCYNNEKLKEFHENYCSAGNDSNNASKAALQ